MLIGYCSNVKAYYLFYPITSKFIVSKDVTFNEDAGWNWNMSSKIEITPFVIYEELFKQLCSSTAEGNIASRVNIPAQSNNFRRTQSKVNGEGSCGSELDTSVESPVRKTRSLAEIYENCTLALNVTDPCTYEEATKIEV